MSKHLARLTFAQRKRSHRRKRHVGAWLECLEARSLLATDLVSDAIPSSTGDFFSSSGAAMSADGRYVAFTSRATNLVTDDNNHTYDIFVRDTVTGTITRANTDSSGEQADGGSVEVATSDDGRFVVFSSSATNLVPGDTNGTKDIFVKDMQTGTTTLVSTRSNGVLGNGSSESPVISGDGRFVAFLSGATNLVLGDDNGDADIFVKDRLTGTTTRVSTNSDGAQANNSSFRPSISDDGRYVAFGSSATNLVSGDSNFGRDVFVKDTLTEATIRVSTSTSGVQGNNHSDRPSISGDGRYVAFQTDATNLVTGGSAYTQVLLKDMATGTTIRVNADAEDVRGNEDATDPTISADGRYVAFQSKASNLVPNDTNDFQDIFVKDTVTDAINRISTDSHGEQGNSLSGNIGTDPFDADSIAIDANARYVVYPSLASNLVEQDTNGAYDFFLKDAQTGTMTALTTPIAALDASGNGDSFAPALSGDGRYVVFHSTATNLVEGDTNLRQDVFVKDTLTGTTTLVSTDSSGLQGNENSGQGYSSISSIGTSSISRDGRYVAFQSSASNLTADRAGGLHVYVKDRLTGATSLVSASAAGAPGNNSSGSPVISGDGRFVAFASIATNLVTGHTGFEGQVFVKDLVNGSMKVASTSSNGDFGDSDSGESAISNDGRYVAFRSRATNLVRGDTNDHYDIFLKDMLTGTTTRISTDGEGVQANAGSHRLAISGNGRYVAFLSSASNLVEDDENRFDDIFVKDVQTGVTTLVSTNSEGLQTNYHSQELSISDDGRFVAFLSQATNLVAVDLVAQQDVFLKDLLTGETTLISTDSDGIQENFGSFGPSISGDGRYVAFYGEASNLSPYDRRPNADVFRASRSLYPDVDYGDAPAPYPTTMADGGARHAIGGPRLGVMQDAEPDGQGTTLADGEGIDDDGVTFGTIQVGASDAKATVTVSAAGQVNLSGWVDFGQDGTWEEGDQILADRSLEPGVHVLVFDVPDTAVAGTTFARFRVSTAGGLDATGEAPDGEVEDYAVEVIAAAAVVGRYVFYNNSAWDGDNGDADAADDEAIATDKTPLLPGGTASFANYTSYSRGITGVMIDVANVPGTITAADFGFKTGNTNNTATWTPLTAAPTVTLRPGEGDGGSTRVSLTWPDATIKKTWLQVTVLASAATGLTADDVFYFGNAIGEAGDATANALVNATDEVLARANPLNIVNPASIDFLYDFNRDKLVNATDQIIARTNATNIVTALRLIAPVASAAAIGAGEGVGLAALVEAAQFAGDDEPGEMLPLKKRR